MISTEILRSREKKLYINKKNNKITSWQRKGNLKRETDSLLIATQGP